MNTKYIKLLLPAACASLLPACAPTPLENSYSCGASGGRNDPVAQMVCEAQGERLNGFSLVQKLKDAGCEVKSHVVSETGQQVSYYVGLRSFMNDGLTAVDPDGLADQLGAISAEIPISEQVTLTADEEEQLLQQVTDRVTADLERGTDGELQESALDAAIDEAITEARDDLRRERTLERIADEEGFLQSMVDSGEISQATADDLAPLLEVISVQNGPDGPRFAASSNILLQEGTPIRPEAVIESLVTGLEQLSPSITKRSRVVSAVTCPVDTDEESDTHGNIVDGGTNQPFSVLLAYFASCGNVFTNNVEAIAFDESAGIFNYYSARSDGVHFDGNVEQGFSFSGNPCDRCHTGGGPIMKELPTPWLHWEGHMDVAMAPELVESNEELLGRKASGSGMESLVESANDRWNETRVEMLAAGATGSRSGLKRLLEPLFCSVELNVDNGSSQESAPWGMSFDVGGDAINTFAPFDDRSLNNRFEAVTGFEAENDDLGFIPRDFLYDTPQGKNVFTLSGGSNVTIDPEHYDTAIKMLGQELPGMREIQSVLGFTQQFAPIDAVFDFTFIQRSFADANYVQKLIDAEIISEDFARAVLMVDFTHPVMSEDRCELLDQFVPSVSELTPAAISQGFMDELAGTSSLPGQELLLNLQEIEAGESFSSLSSERIRAYTDACKARQDSEVLTDPVSGRETTKFVLDVVALADRDRHLASRMHVFEFDGALPFTDEPAELGQRLDPNDCSLAPSFVPVDRGDD